MWAPLGVFLLPEVVLKLTEIGWLASVGENAGLAALAV